MSTPDYAGAAQATENKRQAAIKQGTQSINQAYAGFTPGFYQQRAQAYTDYALPQLSQQYGQMKNQIGFNVANRGYFGGSAANKQISDLNQQMGVQKQGIVDAGITQAQQLQNQVEQQRNTLLGQLYQSADPGQVGQQATATAASFQYPTPVAPLGNMFANLANQYYQSQLINAYKPTSYVSLPPSYGGGTNAGALPGVGG